MNKLLRFSIVAFTLLALLMGAFPAAAKEKTVVTGEGSTRFEVIAGDEWVTDHYIYHFRNEYINQHFVASDPLEGYSVMNNNGEYYFTEDWDFQYGHFWATWTIYAEFDFITPKWECNNTGKLDNKSLSAKGVCQGVGENAGLHVKLWFTTDYTTPYMVLYGEIH